MRIVLVMCAALLTACPIGQLLPDGGVLLPDGGSTNPCGTEAELCTAQGKNCGVMTVSDRCNQSRAISCGSCMSPQSCGGGGTVNVCGASCTGGCPSGFTCNLFGVCAGGSLTNLNLDVKTVPVSGTVTLNGNAPATGTSCNGNPTGTKASVTFIDAATGTSLNAPILCPSNPFTFSTNLPPGTYQVFVTSYGPSWSSLPDGRAGIFAARDFTTGESNLVLDVKTVPVNGTVTLNGNAPATGTSCNGNPTGTKASVTFIDDASGTSLNAPVLCPSNPFTFSTNLPPGTYQVFVTSYGPSWSSLPDGRAGIFAARSFTVAESNLVLDVKTVPVSGTVTLNGNAPATGTSCNGNPTGTKASVTFIDTAAGTSLNAPVLCPASPFTFSTNLPPGTYQVFVTSYGPSWSSLPDGRAGIFAAHNVTVAESSLVLDVKTLPVNGTVTLNGNAPTTGTSCNGNPTGTKASVTFIDATSGTSLNAPVLCPATPFAFSTNLPPGTYQVFVSSYGPSWSSLPDGRAGVLAARNFTVAESSLVLDVKTVPVSGTVTLNGNAPATGTSCNGNPTGTKASVTFSDDTTGTSLNAPVLCPANPFAFSTNLPSGLYRVYVTSYGPSWSSLPDGRAGLAKLLVP